MQWHPIFAHLLRPLLDSHYEVRTGQTVGDMPRESDIVLLRKTTTSPAPFHGLWSRLTPWSLLEYKGPTVSARFDELHDLIELGLGIHRRLNELQRIARQPEMDYPDMSFWYLVNHLGERFLADLPRRLPGVQQQADGLWMARVFEHPLFLVSVQELQAERDSLPLHLLAGVPEANRGTLTAALKAEPALWPNYGGWLAYREPAIWQEILLMAAQQEPPLTLDVGPLRDYLNATGGLKSFLDGVPVEQLWAALSPEQREQLLRLLREENVPGSKPA